MATLLMRDYGALGSGNAATDAATWRAAVNDSKAGDTIHVVYSGGNNDIKLPGGATNRKNGVTIALDEAVRLFPQSTAESFPAAGMQNVSFILGDTNGHGSGENAGKWQMILDPAQNAGMDVHTSVSRFQSCKNVRYENLYILSNWDKNESTGQPTANANTVAAFAYPNQSGLCSFIYLIDVTNDHCTAGYGLCQVQGGEDLFFTRIKCIGGTCLRIEQDAGVGANNTINRLTANGVWAKWGNCAVQLNAHIPANGGGGAKNLDIRNVTSEECMRAVRLDAHDTGTVSGVAVRGGMHAQIKLPQSGPSRWWKPGKSESVLDGDGDNATANLSFLNVFYDGVFANSTTGNTPIPASGVGSFGAGFTVTASAPTVTAIAASSITTVGATLGGTVDPNDAATTWYFEYGTAAPAYGTKAPVPSGSLSGAANPTAVSVAIPASGTLDPSTTYHWRLVGINSAGTSVTSDQTFTTLGSGVHVVPTVTVNPASAIGQTTANLSGTVNPDGDSTVYQFDYGATSSYGSTAGLGTATANSGNTAVTASLSGLNAGQVYHYRLRAVNANGTAVTSDAQFSTTSGVALMHPITPQAFASSDVTLIGGVSGAFSSPKGTAVLPVNNNYAAAEGDVLISHMAWEDGNPSPGGGGTTTLYLRSTTANVGSHTATEHSSAWTATASRNVIQDLSESPNTVVGGVVVAITTLANTTAQKDFWGRWISPTITAGTIDANTWTIALSGNEADLNANRQFGCSIYVENAAGTVVGYVYDDVTAVGSEFTTANQGRVFTVAGSAVVVGAGARLVFEPWTTGTQSAANAYKLHMRYDGTTAPAQGVTVTDAAAYIQAPQNLFGVGPSAAGTVGFPAGWQRFTSGTVSVGGTAWMNSTIGYHVVGNTSEPANYKFTAPTTNGGAAALYAFRGVNTTLLAGASPGRGTATSGTVNPGTVSTTIDHGAVLYMTSLRSATTIGFPASYSPILTSEPESAGAGVHQIAAAVKPIPAFGASGGMNGVLGASAPWVAFALPLESSGGTSPPPPPPGGLLLTVTLDEEHGRVRLLIDDTSGNAVTASATARHPSGRVRTIRGADNATLIGSELQTYDYEVPIRRKVTYSATSYDADGNVVGMSDPTDVFWDTDDDWLSDPLLPAHALPLHVSGVPTEVFDARVGTHKVLGRPAPVTTSQVRAAATGQLGVFTNTSSEFDELHLMTAPGHVLLLRTDPERGYGSLYFMPNTIEPQRVSPVGAEAARIWQFDYQEVDPPSGAATGGSTTWQSVVDTYETWQAVLDAQASWSDVLDGLGISQSSAEVLAWRGA